MNDALTIYASQISTSELLVRDLTLPLRYDEDQTGQFYRLTLTDATGRVVLVAQTNDTISREWTLGAGQYMGQDHFDSGRYHLVLERMGPAVFARPLANYFVRTKLKTGDSVWVQRNGAWLNVTAEGTISGTGADRSFEWHLLNSYEIISAWYVMGPSGMVTEPAQPIVDIKQLSTYDNENGQPVSLLAGSTDLICCRAERDIWTAQVLELARGWGLGRQPASGRGLTPPALQRELLLFEVGGYLTLMETGSVIDPGTVDDLLRIAQARLTELTADLL